MPGDGDQADSGARAELVVIGGGPGGYPAAFDAADRGMDVTLVNDEAIPGGVCLHRGCIPSKALLHVAALLGEAHEATQWGITFAQPKVELDKLRSFKESVVKKLTGGVGELCKARGVKLVQARARFLDSTTLELKKPARRKSWPSAKPSSPRVLRRSFRRSSPSKTRG